MGLKHLSPPPPPLFPTVTGTTPSSFGLGLAGLPQLPEFVEERQEQDKVHLTETPKTHSLLVQQTCM